MKRLICIFLSAALVLGLLGGCTEEKPYTPTGDGLYDGPSTAPTQPDSPVEQQFNLAWYEEKGLNPYTTADYTNRVIIPLLYQGLFSVSSDYEAVPILCSRYTRSEDMRVYTFWIEEAFFTDGSQLTAGDVAASWLHAMESPVYSGRLTAVESIAVTEDGGVCITLTTPYENLPLLLDIPIVKSSELAYDRPQGTGPYYLSASMDGSTGLQRKKTWWCQTDLKVTASFIPLVEVCSAQDVRNAFEYGGVGFVCTDPGADTYVDYRSDHEVWQSQSGIFLYLGCREKSSVFSVDSVRQALTHAIDRALLAEDYYRGFAMAAYLPCAPDSPWYSKALASKYGYDAVQFQQAVTDAGLTGSRVTLLVNKADSRRVKVARAIARMLSNCGLEVTVSALSGDSYLNALKRGNFDLHLGQTVLSPNMDLSAFYASDGSLNYGGMNDAALLALCQNAMENQGNYYTLHKMAMEDAVLCPVLFKSYAIYAPRNLFTGLEPARDQLFFYTRGKTLADVCI